MLDLTEEKRRALLGFTAGPGYPAILDVMEQLLTIGETQHFKIDRRKGFTTSDQVLSSHDQCRAKREFFEEVQMEIAAQIAHFAPPREEGASDGVQEGN